MKIIKFDTVQDQFVRKPANAMTLDDIMKQIGARLLEATQTDTGKPKGRIGTLFVFNESKSKAYARIKYGNAEAYCIEEPAKTDEEARKKIAAYAEAITAGQISEQEKELIRKAYQSRREFMEKARKERKAKNAV